MNESAVSRWLSVALGTGPGSVALLEGPGPALLAERALGPSDAPGERLPLLIQELLADAVWEARDLTRLVVTSGPGSFTGLRIGFSLMKAIALATHIPLDTIHTAEARALEALEHITASPGGRITVVTGITADRIVLSRYEVEVSGLRALGEHSWPRSEAESRLREVGSQIVIDTKAAALLPTIPGAITLEASAARLPFALPLARHKARGQGASGLAELAPYYVSAGAYPATH